MTLKELKTSFSTIDALVEKQKEFLFPYAKKEYERRYEKKASFNIESISYIGFSEEDSFLSIVIEDGESVDVINLKLKDIYNE